MLYVSGVSPFRGQYPHAKVNCYYIKPLHMEFRQEEAINRNVKTKLDFGERKALYWARCLY